MPGRDWLIGNHRTPAAVTAGFSAGKTKPFRWQTLVLLDRELLCLFAPIKSQIGSSSVMLITFQKQSEADTWNDLGASYYIYVWRAAYFKILCAMGELQVHDEHSLAALGGSVTCSSLQLSAILSCFFVCWSSAALFYNWTTHPGTSDLSLL